MRTGWSILIYQLKNYESQNRLAEGLNTLGNLIVQTDENKGEYFVTIECRDPVSALTVHELVMSIDASTVLIYTHQETDEETVPGAPEEMAPN
jgi:nitrate reductase NapAB chaperone NapD